LEGDKDEEEKQYKIDLIPTLLFSGRVYFIKKKKKTIIKQLKANSFDLS
jgi:hypothetical protein